jgi:glucose-6-phosphate 1-dehydrogenase
MHMEIHAKRPGLGMQTHVIRMDAGYRQNHEPMADAYEALLADIIRGDATNFIRFDEVEWAWRVVDPILRSWAADRTSMHAYPAGSPGPEAAGALLEGDGRMWRDEV